VDVAVATAGQTVVTMAPVIVVNANWIVGINMDKPVKQIPEHHSAVRHMMSAVRGEEYTPLLSLEEARQYDDSVVILEGDWGGTIFATCPVKYVICDHDTIIVLDKAIELSFWGDNEKHTGIKDGGWGVYYERKAPGSGVSGGMGGGRVMDGLWVHDRLSDSDKAQIRAVLLGETP